MHTHTLFLVSLLAACGSATAPETQEPAAAPLEIAVVTSPEQAGAVNSVLIHGPTEVVIVDAQFTRSAAVAVADAAGALGKPVTRIFISHAHPDHFLGAAILSERFPDARVVATPAVVAEMKASANDIARAREAMLGPEFPGMPVIPTPITTLAIDGVDVEILDGLSGDAHPIAALYLRATGTLIASDVAYADVHLWTATTDHEGRLAWAAQTEALEALPGLARVIPGHQLASSSQTVAALRFTREYIRAFDEAASSASSAAELDATMKARFGDLAAEMFLGLGSQAAFPTAP